MADNTKRIPKVIQRRNKQVQSLFDRYFRLKFLLIGVIFFLLYLVFSDAIKVIVLFVILMPVVEFSMKYSNFVPHINIEFLSGSTLQG